VNWDGLEEQEDEEEGAEIADEDEFCEEEEVGETRKALSKFPHSK